MTPIARAQRRFERLTPEKRAELMVRLCVGLGACAREALEDAKPDITTAHAFIVLLQEVQRELPPLRVVSSYTVRDQVVEAVGALFGMAGTLRIAPRFEAEWDAAWAFVRGGGLGPGANSVGDVLAGITDRAKAQIAACRRAWPTPADTTAIPLICIGLANFMGMFHDRDEAEDDIAAVDGVEVVLAMENHQEPPRGKTLDFDGERFILI